MTSPRSYGSGVVTGLVWLSQGTCYWPNCGNPLVQMVRGKPVNVFEIAHIRAAKPGGPRYDPAMTDAERRDFTNLVLLCIAHHKIVDKIYPDQFTTATLQGWKEAREQAGRAALQGLRGLTEERLEEMISASFASFRSQMDDAIARLASIDQQAARLLRPLVDELAQASFNSHFPSEDTVAVLARAADQLATLEDTTNLLSQVTQELRGLEDTATMLGNTAEQLRKVRGYM